ncbi:MAG: fibronectin type III domain-containing protein [Cellvibrio sp.]
MTKINFCLAVAGDFQDLPRMNTFFSRLSGLLVITSVLLLSACGGEDEESRLEQISDQSSSAFSASSVTPAPASSISSTTVSSGSSSSYASARASNSSSPVVVGVSSSRASSRSSAKSSSVRSSSSSSAAAKREVVIEWFIPSERENGAYLELDEIGGYEIRYKQVSAERYQSVIIEDGGIDHYSLGALSGNYEFQIATFDVNGLYSEFVTVTP